MKKIEYTLEVHDAINFYTDSYRRYYEELYSDTGLWWLDMILSSYRDESKNRRQEILDLIEESLSNELITYLVNTTIVRWRSKILLITFEDEGDARIVTHLEIR